MTSRGHGIGAAWLVAPVAAGTFALATQWTLHHEPIQPTAQTVTRQRPAPDVLVAQRDARLAARRLARVQASVVRLEASLQRRSARADRVESTLNAARQGGPVLAGGGLGGSASLSASAPLPPVQVPSTTHTTTGAS